MRAGRRHSVFFPSYLDQSVVRIVRRRSIDGTSASRASGTTMLTVATSTQASSRKAPSAKDLEVVLVESEHDPEMHRDAVEVHVRDEAR
jgi:hypothetical protein